VNAAQRSATSSKRFAEAQRAKSARIIVLIKTTRWVRQIGAPVTRSSAKSLGRSDPFRAAIGAIVHAGEAAPRATAAIRRARSVIIAPASHY